LRYWSRWSSSGHDKGMHDNEFAGRLDFNQYTREINASDVLHASPKPPQCHSRGDGNPAYRQPFVTQWAGFPTPSLSENGALSPVRGAILARLRVPDTGPSPVRGDISDYGLTSEAVV